MEKLTLQQTALLKFQEECGEGTQIASKAHLFGLDEVWEHPIHNPDNLTNRQRLEQECIDIFASILLMCARGIINRGRIMDPERIRMKTNKVQQYEIRARTLGRLVE